MGNDPVLADLSVEQVELKGFSRSVAELEWLLLILVLLYYVAPGTVVRDRPGVVLAMVGFAAFVLAFRYLNFYTRETRWKLAIETWVMIGFITWVLWNTGGVDSPLLNLYLLVIITSGLTLGKLTTLLEFMLITCCYLYMGYPVYTGASFTMEVFTVLMSKFSPFLLVAYLTTMLSADLHFAKRMFKTLSETDDLTGLLNVRAFGMLVEREMSKSIRYSHAYSIMMIDADELKSINDRFGHEAGNRLIQMVARTVGDCLRTSDILARYGGDEFVVLLPETDREQAREAAERIRTAVQHASFDGNGQRVATTVSIGLASYPGDGATAVEVMDRADKAMYQSKNAGRNCVSSYHSGREAARVATGTETA